MNPSTPSFEDVLVKTRELWQDSDDDNEHGFNEDRYEMNKLKKEIIQEDEKIIKEYNQSQNLILAIVKDMQNKNPDINDDLNKLIAELEENSNIVSKIQKGGVVGTRLSEIEPVHRVDTIQGNFTHNEIQLRLRNFTRISIDELFALPKGVWIRYFLNNDMNGRGLYRTGGFVIHHDPDERYVTLIAHHNDNTPNKQSFTWNMQINTVHSVYALTKNVRKYRLDKIDELYHIPKGTSTMMTKWMEFDKLLLTRYIAKDKNIVVVLYDKMDYKLYSINANDKTNIAVLKKHNMTNEQFIHQYKKKLKKQLKEPLNGLYIVSLISKTDLNALKKMKSRIKVSK
jgi:hypothetical protein